MTDRTHSERKICEPSRCALLRGCTGALSHYSASFSPISMAKTPFLTVCDSCGRGTWYDTEQPCKMSRPVRCGCCDQTTGEHEPCPGTLRVIDNSYLDPRLTPFYESGERVEVTLTSGETERFYVGKSTGWKPIYLCILRRDSSGGAGAPRGFKSVRGLGTYMNR